MLKPLLPAFIENEAFFVLALSQHDVHLHYGRALSMVEVDLGETPRSLEEALRYDTPDAQVTFHGSARPGGPRSPGGTMWHGHADIGSTLDRDIFLFMKQVNAGVHRVLGEQTTPLILAGVEYEMALYRQANTYPYLAEAGVDGNPKLLSPAELHAAGVPDGGAGVRAAYGRGTRALPEAGRDECAGPPTTRR